MVNDSFMKRTSLMLAVFLFFASAYLITFRGHYGSDQFLSYLTAESIVLDHSLAIGKRNFNVGNIHGNMERAPTGRDGQRYTLFGLALPLAMTPFYLIGHLASVVLPVHLHDYVTMFFVSMTNVFVTALICSLLFYYLSILGHSSRTALIVALLYGFGTMAWNYSQYSFAEPLLSLLFLCALLMVEKWETAGRYSPITALGLGCVLGLCLLTEIYAALFIVPAILIYLFVHLWRRRPGWRATCSTMTCAVLPVLAGTAILLWFYWLRFGGLAAPRLEGHLSPAFIPASLCGFLFSPGKSFFLFAPPAMLALCGIKYFFDRNRDLAVMLAAITVVSVLFISTYGEGWRGGWAWGPRYLFHLMLMAMLPLAEAFDRKLFAAGWKRHAAGMLILVSILIQFGGILINTGVYVRFVEQLQPGADQYFVPYLSAIPVHWLLAVATVYRWLSGHALMISCPAGSRGWCNIRTDGFEGLDLWFTNLPQYWHHPAAFWVSLFGTTGLLIAAALFFRYIWHATAE